MDEIKYCSNFEIKFSMQRGDAEKLPVDEITNWLERSTEWMEMESGVQKVRSLRIALLSIENAREIQEHLETVYFKHILIEL